MEAFIMKKTIFLFDGDLTELVKVRNVLESLDYEVTTASSYDEAKSLYYAKEDKFDLSIFELNYRGFELFRHIRSKDKYVDMMVRSNSEQTDIMCILINVGIDGYVSKLTTKELTDQVKHILNR
jgi:DNA-binding response OmpR family regulator